MPNYWTTAKSSFASWYVTFPHVSVGGVDRLLRFAEGLLEAGERERVYRLLQTRGPEGFEAGEGFSNVDYMSQVLERTGVLPLFSDGGGVAPAEAGIVRTPGRVAYYDETDDVVEEEVDDLGLLLQRLRPEHARHHMGYMSRVAPVSVSGLTIVDTRQEAGEPVYVGIKLDTDIWFPRVVGFLEEDTDAPTSLSEMFDNSPLASRHTPRLNRFISYVHNLTLDLGGEWELSDSTQWLEHYGVMLHEDGIDLEV